MKIDKTKLIAYNDNSELFQEWESTKIIKLETAFQNHLKYSNQNQDKFKLKSDTGYPLYYVYEQFYIFSTVSFLPKLGTFNATGIWVNANTGEADYVIIGEENNIKTYGNTWLRSYNGEER